MNNGRIVYIIDGPDGTGKTSLCKNLSRMFNIPIYHQSYHKDMRLHNMQFENALDLLRNSETGFILDRYVFSDKVYADVYRNSKYIPLFDDCFNALTYANANIIFTLPKDRNRYLEFFKKLYESRNEMYNPEKMLEVYDGYNDIFNKKWNFNINRFDLFDIIDNKDTENKFFEFNWNTEKYEQAKID